jgi:hypothetical protein
MARIRPTKYYFFSFPIIYYHFIFTSPLSLLQFFVIADSIVILFSFQVPSGIIKPLNSSFPADFVLSGSHTEPLVVRTRRSDLAEQKVRLIPGVPSSAGYKSSNYASHQKTAKKTSQIGTTVNDVLYGRGKFL